MAHAQQRPAALVLKRLSALMLGLIFPAHKLIRVFDSAPLYWQKQQGIGHCGGGGGGGGGGVCLVRN